MEFNKDFILEEDKYEYEKIEVYCDRCQETYFLEDNGLDDNLCETCRDEVYAYED